MEKEEIKNILSDIQSKADFLNLINELVKESDVPANSGKTDSAIRPFALRELNFFCNPYFDGRYRQFQIPKKSGKMRTITTPRSRRFMTLLRCINEILKAVYTPSVYAMGFAENRSVATNAEKHKGHNYVYNIDLKDFFPSISEKRIQRRLTIAPFNFTEEIALTVAGLCSVKVLQLQETADTGKLFFVLPQGAPTSPIITNMICDKLDHRLAGLAKRFGLHYSRYADDITFSSMHNVYHENGDFCKELHRIINDQGFTINETKTRLQKKGSRQEVTGITVCEKLNLPKAYTADLRNILYIWERYGYNTALCKFYSKYKNDKGLLKRGTPNMINVIDGRLKYLKMVKGREDSVYVCLHRHFNRLRKSLEEQSASAENNITIISTDRLTDFEQKNATEVKLIPPKKTIAENAGICIEEENEHSESYAQFLLGNHCIKAYVANHVWSVYENDQEQETKQDLFISRCKTSKSNGRAKQFWLIHDNKVRTGEQDETVSASSQYNNINKETIYDYDKILDELIEELNQLLNQ